MSTSVLTNTSNIKSLLGITSTAYDARISQLLPIVIDDINQYTNNWFLQSTRYIYTNDINFSTSGSITLETTDWTMDEDFRSGDTIYVSGSKFNDNYFTLSTAGSSFVSVNESVITEASTSGKMVLINRVDFPKDLELIASQMIGYKLNQDFKGVASESIGDYSISYQSVGLSNYPSNIINSLNKYKFVRIY